MSESIIKPSKESMGGVKSNRGLTFNKLSFLDFLPHFQVVRYFDIRKKVAFTLAEVLITLVIIGVIAAITVPTIHANSQDKALKAALKKNFSVFGQALERYYFQNGIRFTPEESIEKFSLKTALKQNLLNIAKDCGANGNNAQGCLGTGGTVPNTYKSYNGKTNVDHSWFDDGHLALSDGSYVMLENAGNHAILFISVDVNGQGKKPNRLGKDLFMFQILSNGKLVPMGAKGTYFSSETYCSDTSTNKMNGAGCTAKVLGQY